MASRGDYNFSLLVLDVDYFKQINDHHGHQIGDQVLKFLAAQLEKQIRSTDMLFRIGGEEFVIITPTQESKQAYQLAKRLHSHINTLEPNPLPKFTVSFGVANYEIGDTSSLLFNRADQALYQAKAQGRDCIVIA